MSENTKIEKEIKKVLNKLRPHLQLDGGDVEFVSFDLDSGVLRLRLQGSCHNCPMSMMTLQHGIGAVIKDKIPEVKELIAV